MNYQEPMGDAWDFLDTFFTVAGSLGTSAINKDTVGLQTGAQTQIAMMQYGTAEKQLQLEADKQARADKLKEDMKKLTAYVAVGGGVLILVGALWYMK